MLNAKMCLHWRQGGVEMWQGDRSRNERKVWRWVLCWLFCLRTETSTFSRMGYKREHFYLHTASHIVYAQEIHVIWIYDYGISFPYFSLPMG